MEIPARRLMELAVHVKVASESVLEAARSLAEIEPGAAAAAAWTRTADELLALNTALGFMERILRTATGGSTVALPTRSRRPATS
jgi:mevalonate pyrophosphate decarboxylase